MKKILSLLKIFIYSFLCLFIIIFALYLYALITPKFDIFSDNNIIYYDINYNDIFNKENNNNYITLNNITKDTVNAIISIEDKNFYKHKGFDILRIIKALFINIKNNKIIQGASTISQQYVKNLFLTFDKTWKRKLQEAYLTIELETHYSKDEIIEGYLNAINFGAGNYGIKEASNYYFNKEPNELSIEEATILVGIPKNPTYYNPITNYNEAKNRQKDVLYSMYKNGYIEKNDIETIYNKQINFYGKKNKTNLSSIYYYKDAVNQELLTIKNIPNNLLNMNGLKIYTNLDTYAQSILENNIDNEMKNTNLQVASVIIDPKTGKILSLIGGKNYEETQYNRAYFSKRQVGSTIKPFIYYNALNNGFTASSTFLSEKTTFNLDDATYSPKNAGNIYANKNISMLSAIAYSDNIYAIKTHLFLGTSELSNIIEKLKVQSKVKENASAALGTTEINIIDYSNAYITLANNGKHENPHLIEKITDMNDNIIYEYEYEEEYLLNNKYVYILNNLLSSTYDYSLINYTSPTMISIKNDLNKQFAVKSGSTDTDFWTIGYNNNYLVMVWNGYDDNTNVESKYSKITKKIWAKTINNLEKNDNVWYKIPKNVIGTFIDPISGEFKDNGYLCFYEKGSEPLNYTFSDILNNKK